MPVLADPLAHRVDLVCTLDGAWDAPAIVVDGVETTPRGLSEAERSAYLGGDLDRWRTWRTVRPPVVFVARALTAAETDRIATSAHASAVAERRRLVAGGHDHEDADAASYEVRARCTALESFRLGCLSASLVRDGEPPVERWDQAGMASFPAVVRRQIGELIAGQTEVNDPFFGPSRR